MNRLTMELDMKSTFFDTPHGLANWFSLSSALDLSKLSSICMKNKLFTKIVSTKIYKVPYR